MRRHEDRIKLAAYAIFAALSATFAIMLVEFLGWKVSAMIFCAGLIVGTCYWAWCKRSEGREEKEEEKKKEAPSAEYNHDLTREERQNLSKEMREFEEQLKKPAKKP